MSRINYILLTILRVYYFLCRLSEHLTIVCNDFINEVWKEMREGTFYSIEANINVHFRAPQDEKHSYTIFWR